METYLTALIWVWTEETQHQIIQGALHMAQETNQFVVLEGELILNTKSGHGGWSSEMLEAIKLPYRLEEM